MTRLWVATALLCAACSKKGEDAAPISTPPSPTVPGVIDTSIKDLSGSFYVGDAAHPASGYELWTLDHTQRTWRRDLLTDSGTFSIPVDVFTPHNVYTQHLLKDAELIVDIDRSVADGVQQAFTFEGGSGYDLGAMTLKVDTHGAVDRTATSVQGRSGGGFLVAPSSTATFASFPQPPSLSRLAVGSQLFVFDPSTLLHSFYQRVQNPTLYAQDLTAFSRIGVRGDATAIDTLKKLEIAEAGSWLVATRLGAADDDPPHGAGLLWSATRYAIPAIDKKSFSASAFAGGVLSSSTMVVLRAQIGDTDPNVEIPRLFGPFIAVPPLLRTIDLGSGVLATVDYAANAANGLTQAFCRTGALRLGVDPPLDQANAPLPATILNTIDIGFDYYGVASDGKVVAVPIVITDLPAAWQSAAVDVVGDSNRAWNPDTRTFRITLGVSDAGASPHILPVPAELFMPSAAGGGIFYVRLRVYFRSSKGAIESASAVWFNNACPP